MGIIVVDADLRELECFLMLFLVFGFGDVIRATTTT
jgi:hypothetical protein